MIRRKPTHFLAAILTLAPCEAVCGALVPSLDAAGVAAATSDRALDSARMEQVIQSFVADRRFMGSVLVARGNDKLLDKGYGYADLEWNIPDSPKTKYRLGSLTKQFTAAAILLLQERGKLNVHDLITKYMPDAPAAWDKITIFNLLTHTSGISNFTDFPDYGSFARVPNTPEQLVKRFRDKPLDFQPGERWQYSNSGYAVLGYLIEKISGKSYQDFLEENIFKPMGLMESGYDSNFAIIPDRASGYSRFGDGFNNASYLNMTVPFAAGGLYSTTGDLLRWEQSLFGGKLLSAELLHEMTTPFKNEYAFGLGVRTIKGQKVIEHAGGIDGFNTELAYYPEDKLTVVVLANLEGSAAGEISQDLATLAEGGKVVLTSDRKVVHINPKVFDGYVGGYQLGPNFILKVTRDGDRYITQATGQGPVEIFPESDRDFFAKVVNAQITFVTDQQGRATELILHQGGRDQHAKRVE